MPLVCTQVHFHIVGLNVKMVSVGLFNRLYHEHVQVDLVHFSMKRSFHNSKNYIFCLVFFFLHIFFFMKIQRMKQISGGGEDVDGGGGGGGGANKFNILFHFFFGCFSSKIYLKNIIAFRYYSCQWYTLSLFPSRNFTV